MNIAKKIHLQPEEKIIEVVRRYAFTYAWQYVFGLVLLFTSAFFMFWLIGQGWWGDAVLGLGVLAGLLVIFRTWFFNSFNLLVVTTDRVIDINRPGWFEEVISFAGYGDIQDAFIAKRGVFSSIFNYGTLTVETKSRQFVLEIEKIHCPQRIQALIVEYRDKHRFNRRLSTREAVYNNFLKVIPELSESELIKITEEISRRRDELDGAPDVGEETR